MQNKMKNVNRAGRERLSSTLLGVSVGLLFGVVNFAWSYMRLVGFSAPMDIGVVLLLSMLLLFFIAVRRGLRIKIRLSGLILISLTAVFLVMGLQVGDDQNVMWLVFGLVIIILFHFVGAADQLAFFNSLIVTSLTGCIGILLTLGLSSESLSEVGRLSVENTAYTLIAYSAGASFVIGLFCFALEKSNKSWCLILMVVGITLVFASGGRSVYAGIILASVFIATLATPGRRWLVISRSAIIVFFGCIGLAFFFSERAMFLFEAISSAAETFLGGSVSDESAYMRVVQRRLAVEIFLNHPLSGAGIKHFWVDFPLLQAFSDLGLFLGGLYLLIFLVTPLYFCFVCAKNKSDSVLCLLGALYILNLPRLFLHGQPYDWSVFIFVAPLVAYAKYSRWKLS